MADLPNVTWTMRGMQMPSAPAEWQPYFDAVDGALVVPDENGDADKLILFRDGERAGEIDLKEVGRE